MPRAHTDLAGRTFGRLTVISVASKNPMRWNVVCSCRTFKTASPKTLLGGHALSCGCWRSESSRIRATRSGCPILRSRWHHYKCQAQQKNREFSLTKEQFKVLVTGECHYCGAPPPKRYQGIDRVDSSIGYSISNSVSCCLPCNQSKNNRSLQDFQDWIRRAYARLQRN